MVGAALDTVGVLADGAALLLPIPGGAGAARNADKVGKVGKWFNNFGWVNTGTKIAKNNFWAKYAIRGLQGLNVGTNSWQTFDSAKRAYQEWKCDGGIPWGSLFETGLNGLATLGSLQTLGRSLKKSYSRRIKK